MDKAVQQLLSGHTAYSGYVHKPIPEKRVVFFHFIICLFIAHICPPTILTRRPCVPRYHSAAKYLRAERSTMLRRIQILPKRRSPAEHQRLPQMFFPDPGGAFHISDCSSHFENTVV